jgi:predicted MFS family arabinose efflux permease
MTAEGGVGVLGRMLGPYGVLRGNRKVLMISADLGRGVCMLVLLFAGSEETLWIAYPLVFLATVFSSLFQPAMSFMRLPRRESIA